MRALAASLILAFAPAVASAQNSADPFEGPAAAPAPARMSPPPAPRRLPPPETLDDAGAPRHRRLPPPETVYADGAPPQRRLPPPETLDGDDARVVPASPEPVRRQRLALEQPEPRSQGWALGAGIYGFVASGLALSLGIASEATRHDLTGAELGGVDTLFVAVSAPVVEAGAASTRRRTGAPGLYGARLTGWLSYAFSMLDAVAIFAYANIDAPRSPPGGWITSFTVLATASMLCMSADAIASSSQGARMTERASVRRPLVEVAPSLGVASGTASVGVVGAF